MFKFLSNEIKTIEVLFKIDENRIIFYHQVDSEGKQTQSWQSLPVKELTEILAAKSGAFIEFNSPGTSGLNREEFEKYRDKYIKTNS